MKCLLLLWCFAVNVSILLCQYALLSEDSLFHEAANKEGCPLKIPVNESTPNTHLPPTTTLTVEECGIYKIDVSSSTNTSIWNITAEIERIAEQETNDNSTSFNGTFEIQILETSRNILRATWDNATTLKNEKYLSRNSNVSIKVNLAADWNDSRLIISHDEIKFIKCDMSINISKDTKIDESLTRPNSVHLYRLQGGLTNDWRNYIIVTVRYLFMDIAVGDYLLIGSGTEPFEKYPPLFVMQTQNDTNFYVNDSNAYIALVTGPSEVERRFYIELQYTKTAVKDQDGDPFGMLNSTKVCFKNVPTDNVTDEIDKFNTQFLEEVASTMRNDSSKYGISEEDLESLEVELHLSEWNNGTGNISQPQYVMQVKSKKKSILTQKQLDEIIIQFRDNEKKYDSAAKLKIPCKENGGFDWIILCVPVSAIFFLAVWAYKQKVFHQQCSRLKYLEETAEQMHAVPNAYTTTTPKVYQEDEAGRRTTLVPANFGPEAEERFQIPMNDMNPSTSQEAGSVSGSSRLFHLIRSRRRPSIQSILDPEDRSEGRSAAAVNEVTDDHLYDSLRSKEEEELETQL